MKKGLFVIVVLVLSYAILAVGNGMLGSTETVAGGEVTLTGTAEGFGGEVSVIVTMDGNKIIDVVPTGANETPGIGTNAIEQLPAKIIEANSTEVEVIAGATFTSDAIIEAVNNALASNAVAGDAVELTGTAEGFAGEVSVIVTMNGDKIVDVVPTGADETPGIGTNAIEQLPAKIIEANSTEVDVIAGATFTSNAIIEAVNNALESAN